MSSGQRKSHNWVEKETLTEKCAVYGTYGVGFDAARLTYFGLFALQHRGQESSGIAASDGKKVTFHKGLGLVSHVYDEKILSKLKGFMAIGHNRYSTSGGNGIDHVQPVIVKYKRGVLALAHNGNLPSTKKLQEFLSLKKVITKKMNDSEMMAHAIGHYLSQGKELGEAIKLSYPLFSGAFCLTVMTKDTIAAVRDSRGIRPLCIGKLNGGYIFSSETCALDIVGAQFLRDVKPGEMVLVNEKGLLGVELEKGSTKLDVFEFVYFARPDSFLLGKSVDEVRQNLGVQLAVEQKIEADLVIPVPDSAIPAALGYARQSGTPFYMGIIKNRYVHRTFIQPEQHSRKQSVQLKLNPMKHIISGKRVVLVDDSIVRGTTTKEIVKMIRNAGAKEVHLVISSPPVKYPDFYGINTPEQKELIGARKTVDEIREELEADSLQYLSFKGLIKAVGVSEELLCTACFTGEYPIDIAERREEIFRIA